MSKLVENYLLQQTVGKGVYGQVYRAVHQKNKGTFAVKVIPKSSFRSNPKLEQLAINEINILSSIKHQNIVRFIETLKTPNNFYFVYEFCNEGTLESVLKKRKFLKENQALIYFKQLIEAFKQLNKNNIMHRDLKPDNIFLSDNIVKLGDFGFCKMLEVNMAQTMLGSPIYMAPQILKQQIYTSKADIWSLGVVLFQMLFGYCPFQSSSISELINKLKEMDVIIPKDINWISEETQILLRKMLVKDQFKRIQWVDLFGFVIDEKGKIVSGCKKQYAIQNLQRYFLNQNQNNAMGSINNITYAMSVSSNGSNDPKYSSFKELESTEKAQIKQRQQNYTGSAQYIKEQRPNIIERQFDNTSLNENNMSKKPYSNNNNDSQPYSPLQKLTLKHKPESMPAEPLSKKKVEKQRFGDVHNRWLDAAKLVEDIALNSVDGKSVEVCVYILLRKLLQRLQKQSQNYPQWTDVLIQEKTGLKQAMNDLQKLNKDILKQFEDEKENRGDQKLKAQLIKIWQSARNKYTLQRAIRTAYQKQSKEISVYEILA